MKLFFELIQVALGTRSHLSYVPSQEDWCNLFRSSQKQSIVGVAFEGIKMLPDNQRPPKTLLFEWIAIAEQIKKQNIVAYKKSVESTKIFANAGFRSCILKGQGNALMYNNPFCRMSGDIDIWVEGKRNIITEFVKKRTPKVFEQYHHIDFPIFRDISVEVHYTPGMIFAPQYNKKFQMYCSEQIVKQMCHCVDLPEGIGKINVPTKSFNAVYQMVHIMNHFFVEGIGLRHFIDYYYVLKKLREESLEMRNSLRVTQLFKDFGLLRFAGGVMWIEKECLGLEDKFLLVEPDEIKGTIILKEMLEGGNFGHYDERYKSRNKGYLARGITDTYRLFMLAKVFPVESMWKLYRKIGNQWWKIKK